MLAAHLEELVMNFESLALVFRFGQEEHITKRAATHFFHVFILTIDSNFPHGVHSLQLAKIVDLHDASLSI